MENSLKLLGRFKSLFRFFDYILLFGIIFSILLQGDVFRAIFIGFGNESSFTIKGNGILFLILISGIFSLIKFGLERFLAVIEVSINHIEIFAIFVTVLTLVLALLIK